MLIAALDSTAVTASAAIVNIENGAPVTHSLFTVKNKLTHSELLLPLLENALSSYGADVKDIDLFAVSAGPGSFTGVRIGAATLKGLAFTENKPCVGVSALAALAANVGNGFILPVMDARRDQFYTALLNNSDRVTEDAALSIDEIRELIKSLPTVTICGDGACKLVALLSDLDNLVLAPLACRDQNALSVAICAYEEYTRGNSVSPKELSPVYLRLPQAERERLEREKNGNINI